MCARIFLVCRESAKCCDAEAAAVEFSPAAAIKVNPLLARSGRDVDGDGTPEDRPSDEEIPVFYGQRTKIRRTKEQEMKTAILELTEKGKTLLASTLTTCMCMYELHYFIFRCKAQQNKGEDIWWEKRKEKRWTLHSKTTPTSQEH